MMKYRIPFPLNYRFLRLVRLDVVCWQHRRFLSTVAARNVPNAGKIRRKIPKEERKNMVVEYINKCRMMKGGKFPTVSDTRREVGGSYYTVKLIMQELEYNSKLPVVATTDELLMVGQKAQVDENSEAREVIDNQVQGAEDGFSSQGEVGNNSCQKMVDVPIATKKSESSAEDASGSETMIDLEVLSGSVKKSTIDVDQSRESMLTSVTPVLAAIDNISMGRQTAKIDKIPQVGETLESQVQVGQTIAADDYVISVECGSSSRLEVANSNRQKVSDVPVLTNSKNLAEDASRSQTMIDRELQRECMETSSVILDISRGSGRVSETPFLLEQTPVDDTIEAMAMKGSGIPAMRSHSSEVHGTCRTKELGDMDASSSRISDFIKSTRESRTQKTQDNENPKPSLWGHLKSFASNVINIWRKS